MKIELPSLPLIQKTFWTIIEPRLNKQERKRSPEFTLTMFKQTWGSTALGFGGIGGQAMTDAYTTVIEDEVHGWAGVFFGERLAYIMYEPNQKFYEDLRNHQMCSAFESVVYKRS